MSAYEEYKIKMKAARPWDLLNSDNYADEKISSTRYEICLSCPELINLTKQCKQCGCVMPLKTKLINASCPLSKW